MAKISKQEIKTLLKDKKYDEIARLAPNDRQLLSSLISMTYDKADPISWRAMETIGYATKEISKQSPEIVTITIGRLLWMIRDESGGIGWSCPEILGEIVRNTPAFYSHIATIIVSFHEEVMLTAGVARAIGRMGRLNNGFAEFAVSNISQYLDSPDPVIRAYTAWALGEIGAVECVYEIERLKDDSSRVVFYEEGELIEKTVGEVAIHSVEKLKAL
ncbi:MAG: HEAT repeat domain-containing protein [Nitrospirae bacterium]|nr:HEAT repeat domain-containing protein [Nitrospirota bacterium]